MDLRNLLAHAVTVVAREGADLMQTDRQGGAAAEDPPLQVEGVVQPQGITFYQYGSHVLTDPGGTTLFALRSDDPELLDRVTGRRVRVSGRMVVGYPVDMGPLLLDVQDVTDA